MKSKKSKRNIPAIKGAVIARASAKVQQPDEPPRIDPLRRYSIDVASALLFQSRAKTYNDFAAGTLKSIHDGTRRYVPGSEIIRRSTLPG